MERYQFTLISSNHKTGPIPVSTTSGDTCPDACPLKLIIVDGIEKDGPCYANSGPLAWHWKRLMKGLTGISFQAFLDALRSLPTGTLWRHNQAGDLPGQGDSIDQTALAALVKAAKGTRGFTFTHKPVLAGPNSPVSEHSKVTETNRKAIKKANANGFTINLSANTLQEADDLLALNIGPVVVMQDAPLNERTDQTTPKGNQVTTCPATYRENVTCQSCQLCQRQNRKVIVGFPAHGNQRKAALNIVRSR